MADDTGGRRLTDAAVEQRLARLDDVLGRLEQVPGRTAELALEAVETLTEVYGEALARVVDAAAVDRPVLEVLAGDELLRHLLLLHGVHPDGVAERVARAVEDVRGQLRGQGADVELIGIDGGVARVQVSSGGCGCGTTTTVEELLRDEVLAAAPELTGVEAVAPPAAPALIPVDALLRRPAGAVPGGPG